MLSRLPWRAGVHKTMRLRTTTTAAAHARTTQGGLILIVLDTITRPALLYHTPPHHTACVICCFVGCSVPAPTGLFLDQRTQQSTGRKIRGAKHRGLFTAIDLPIRGRSSVLDRTGGRAPAPACQRAHSSRHPVHGGTNSSCSGIISQQDDVLDWLV